MAGFLDFLTSGTPSPTTTTGGTTTSNLPAYYSEYQQALLNNAASIASDPYQAYGGQRIADFTPLQNQGFDFLQNNATNWQQPLNQGTTALNSAATGVNPQNISSWLSPYQKNVTDEIARLGNQQLNETALPQLNSQFVGAGQFGSSRNGQMDEQLIRDTNQNILGQQATALNTGYNSAAQNMIQGANAQTAAGTGLVNAANQTGSLTGGTAGQLEGAGATQQALGQSNLDLGYQDFLNQQNFPRQNEAFLASAASGQQVPTSTTATQTGPINAALSPSLLQTVGGLFGTYAGLQGQNSTATTAKAHGGMVKRFAGGGLAMVPRQMSPISMARRPMAPLSMPMRRPMGGLDRMAA